MKKHLSLIVVILLSISSVLAQRSISGTVTDTEGEPLIGANIVVEGTTVGTITDFEGNFTLDVPGDSDVLVISYLGYVSQKFEIGTQTKLEIILRESTNQLEEIVVIGYGSRDRADLIGAVSEIKSDNIEGLQVNSIEQTLTGQVSGVQLRSNGAPGSGPEVLIRGVASTGGNNAPLYVVDGIPLGNLNSQRDNFILNSIDPSSIESISVLKDASAKAIYGSRASNGVIVIKTKRGKVGKPTITFGTSYGSQSIPDFERPDVLNAEELRQFLIGFYDDRESAGLLTGGERLERDRLNALGDQGAGTNWFDEITRTAPFLRYNIGVNGGSDNVRYNVSASYDNQEGTLINTGFERFSIRANMDVKVNDRIRFGIDLAPTRTMASGGRTDAGAGNFNIFEAVSLTRWVDPSAPVFQENGDLTTLTVGNLLPFYNANPAYLLTARVDERRTNQILMSTYLEADILEGLSFRTFGSLQNIDRRNNSFEPSNLPGANTVPNLAGTRRAVANIGEFNNFNLIWENTLNFTRTIAGDHRISALVGFTMEKRRADNTFINTLNLIDESIIIPNFNNVDPSNVNNFTGRGELAENALVSLIGRMDYSYKAKYYLTATLRRDGSSRFGADSRYGNFPSVAAAWRISNEPFFAGLLDIFSDLKIEGGYGISGSNANIGNYQAQGQINSGNADYVFGGEQATGSFVATLPNSFLTWEEAKEINFGIDVGFLDNRFYLSADYYDIETEGFLAGLPLPQSSGYGSILTNLGSIQNRGIEIELGFKDIFKNSELNWDANVNFTRNRSKTLELAASSGFIRPGVIARAFTETRVGEEVGLYRGFQVTGLFTQAEIDDPNVPKYNGAVEGSMKFLDGNGDGVLGDSEDFVVIGNPNPDFIFGIVNNFRYKNFDLSIVMNGAIGQQIWNGWHQFNGNQDGVFNVDRRQLERWRPGQDPNAATVPGTASVRSRQLYRLPNSIGQLEDASYLWVRNITLGYNFKLENVLKSARVYFSAQNPLLFTEYTSGNPEVNRSGDTALVRNVNYGAYPVARIMTLGLNVSL
jgi:TonB-linked SusC/RagA family outer membrane protein